VGSSPAGGSEQRFCGVVKQQLTLLQGSELSGLLGGGGPAAWKAYLDKVTLMNQELVDAAPPDIQPSVKTLQAGSAAMKDTLATAGYDVSKAGSAKILQLIDTPQYREADTVFAGYVKAHCGIDLTKVGG
jgi:hypothetical protein